MNAIVDDGEKQKAARRGRFSLVRDGFLPRSDEQILFLLARRERRIEPAWAFATARPGLRVIGRIAVFGFGRAPCLSRRAAA